MKVNVYVTLKESISDPQGTAVKNALNKKGYEEVEEVRIGKYIELEIKGNNKEEIDNQVNEMCEKLLANTVIEKYEYNIIEK